MVGLLIVIEWVVAQTQELPINHNEKIMPFLFWQVKGSNLTMKHI